MDTKEFNKEIRDTALILAENVISGRTGFAELKLFTLRILNNAKLVIDEETRKLLNELADASFEHDYKKIKNILKMYI